VLDPSGVGHCYDPLLGKDTEDKLFSAAANILFEPEERDPIFTQRATVMLTQLFAARGTQSCEQLYHEQKQKGKIINACAWSRHLY